MRINVRTLQGRDCYQIVTEETSVSELKRLVADELNVPIEKQRLVFQGKPLQDGMTLHQCGVKDGNKIILSVKEVSKAEDASVVKRSAETCLTDLDLKRELYQVLVRHFTPLQAQNVTEQFLRELHDSVNCLSLDDIEQIAKVNIQSQKS